MSGTKLSMALTGVEQLKRGLLLADANIRTRVKGSIRKGTELVVAGAITRVHKRTGELASTIRAEFSGDGMVGYAKAGYGILQRGSRAKTALGRARFAVRRKAVRAAKTSKQALSKADLGVYAPVVERGDRKRNIKPNPFLVPSLESNRSMIVADIDHSLHDGIAGAQL